MGNPSNASTGAADLVMLGGDGAKVDSAPERSAASSSRPREARLKPSDNHFYFDVVARHGSIRKAAQALHTASSALNRRILDLEQEVGTALFERLPRGVRLTTAGELLLAHVRRSLKDLRQVEADIEQLRGRQRGRVRIAVAESVTPVLLPEAIALYQKSHPGVGFQVLVDGPEALLDAVLSDSVDLILTHELPESHAITVLAIARHPLCAVVASGHSLTELDRVSLLDCMPYPFAVPDHSLAARALLDAAMEDAGLPLCPAVESDSIEMLKSFARLGQAVCFSFRRAARETPPGLVAIPLADPRCADACLYLAARRGRVLPIAAAAFAEELEAAVTDCVDRRSVSVA